MTVKDRQDNSMLTQRYLEIVYFPVKEIIIPEDRIREERPDFKETPKYKALRLSIAKFGLRNPLSIKPNCVLVEGFYRVNCVMDLGWETAPTIIDDLTNNEARRLEFEENYLRMDFTEHEIYTYIAEVKREHEKEYPESKRGKYARCSMEDQDHNTIIPSGGNMSGKECPSFIDTYAPLWGLGKSALYNKAKIGEAILDGIFHPKTIKEIKEGKLTQNQILSKLRQRLNSKVISNKLKNIPKTKSSKIKNVPEEKPVVYKKEIPERPKISSSFNKIEKIIEVAKKDPVAQEIRNKVEKGEISLEAASEQIDKIEDLNISLIQRKVDEPKKIISQVKDHSHEIRFKQVAEKGGLYDDDRCGECSLAHVYVATCFKCAEIAKCLNCTSPIFIVICENDIVNRKFPINFKDPNFKKCKNSPDIKEKK